MLPKNCLITSFWYVHDIKIDVVEESQRGDRGEKDVGEAQHDVSLLVDDVEGQHAYGVPADDAARWPVHVPCALAHLRGADDG